MSSVLCDDFFGYIFYDVTSFTSVFHILFVRFREAAAVADPEPAGHAAHLLPAAGQPRP